MPNEINKTIVKNIREKVSKAKSITFADYIGLKSNDINSLRQKLSESDAEMIVAKNTLIKNALAEEKLKDLDKVEPALKGPTAVILTYKDPVSPLKIVFEYVKNLELPKIKAGIFEGIFASAEQVEVISKLPTKDQLIAQFIGGLKSPITGTVNVLHGVQRKFVYAIKAIADKK